MAWDIEFRYHPDSSIAGVGDNLADLLLRIKLPVGTHALQLGEKLALDAKTFVVGEVPMKHVEFHRSHAVQIALNHFNRHPMPRDIDVQAAPGKARVVVNRYRRRAEPLGTRFDQLQKRLQAAQDT